MPLICGTSYLLPSSPLECSGSTVPLEGYGFHAVSWFRLRFSASACTRNSRGNDWRARELLQADVPIKSIAQDIGMDTPNFCRFIKKHTGLTSARYRNRNTVPARGTSGITSISASPV
jgi:hypothetical protein